MTFDKRIIGALRECKTEQQIEDCFIRFGIIDIQKKQRYLIYAMYAPSIFFSSFQPITEDAVYRMTLVAFTAGHWRYSALCEKFGLVKKPLEDADSQLLDKLTVCTSQHDIDAVFDEEGIYDYRERCNALRRCMRVQEILGDIGISPEKDDYEFDCAVFLEGSLRDG